MSENFTQSTCGILPDSLIKELIAKGKIRSLTQPIEESQIQPASIDLRLGQFAYEIKASFLPGENNSVLSKLKLFDDDFDNKKIDLKNGSTLKKGKIYLIKLQEHLSLEADISAFANPKSSTGRLDILTRLIADNSTIFDHLEEGYEGNIYIEVAPKSFNIKVKEGTRLNQLRFRKNDKSQSNNVSTSQWLSLLITNQISDKFQNIKLNNQEGGMLPFTVDLKPSDEKGIIGYSSKSTNKVIDLEKRNYNSNDFWEPIYSINNSSLVLQPHKFYILMTQEAVAIPPDFAAEMTPYDTRAGEFRVHYAGFFDPGFGYCTQSNKVSGSRGVLEIRSHQVPFLLEHGQIAGWLKYEKMLKKPSSLYGNQVKSNYQGQKLKLAKYFDVDVM